MTSIPESRRALAMIFAPRSCPSSPGFAITTRILPATVSASIWRHDRCGRHSESDVKLTVVGSSPAWPNPGGAQSGYLVEDRGRLLLDCGPGVLARLREQDGWPRVDAIAITHFHLDHWGDLVPWVWGRMYGLGQEDEPPEVWVQPGGRAELRTFGERLGMREMFEDTFRMREYEDDEPFVAAGLQVTPLRLPHYTLRTYGFRVSNEHKTLAYSGDSGPSDRLPELDGQPRGHLSLDEALAAHKASGAKRLLITHRPQELAVDGSLELAYDGLEL